MYEGQKPSFPTWEPELTTRGIAGEIGKRLTNRIANGTVRAVTRLKALCFKLTCFVNQVAYDGL